MYKVRRLGRRHTPYAVAVKITSNSDRSEFEEASKLSIRKMNDFCNQITNYHNIKFSFRLEKGVSHQKLRNVIELIYPGVPARFGAPTYWIDGSDFYVEIDN